MPKILAPKVITGTTRFYFDFNLNTSVLNQLINEFKDEDTIQKNSTNSIKLITTKDNKNCSIELTHEYISFFPILDENEKEHIRKRIYKHVAKKAQVYFQTSKQNLLFAINSLLADDLRSSASLLYYSIHKYVNGELYNYLNKKLDLEDHEIDIKEIEHFTSSNFNTFVLNYERLNTDINNYSDLFKNKNKIIDPFYLIKVVFYENINHLITRLQPFAEFISVYLFNTQYGDDIFLTRMNDELTEFYKKRKSKSPLKQENEVKAGIAYALKKSIEDSENKTVWLFYTLLLRLYWLRQTADYEFDFDVKTSLREMSIILSSVRDIIESQLRDLNSDQNQLNNTDISNKGISSKDLGFQETGTNDHPEIEINTIEFYRVESKFPQEINFNGNISLFLTAVHLDISFNKEKLFDILNMTESITNKEKYFIYECNQPFPIFLHLHVNDDGRWSVWFSDSYFELVTEFDLIDSFQEFIAHLYRSSSELNIEFDPLLIACHPNPIPKNIKTLDTFSLGNMAMEVEVREKLLQQRLTKEFSHKLKSDYSENIIKLYDQEIKVNLYINFVNVLETIPISEWILTSPFNKENLAYYSIIIWDNPKNDIEEINKAIESAYYIYKSIEEIKVPSFQFIVLTSDELDEILMYPEFTNKIAENFSSFINEISYNRIEQGHTKNTNLIIEKFMGIDPNNSFLVATYGYWFFNNQDLDPEKSEKFGKKYYQQAINMDAPDRDDYIFRLQQKYFLELTKFYAYRLNDLEKACISLEDGLSVNEESLFSNELEQLKSVILDSKKLLAASIESN